MAEDAQRAVLVGFAFPQRRQAAAALEQRGHPGIML
jgi:hypothetical protein